MSANPVDPNKAEYSLLTQLLSRQAAEKEKGWKHVYKSYRPMVQEYVQKNGGTKQDAKDIFHDGLAILLYNLDTGKFREESNLNTYFFGICKNLWQKELTQRQKELVTFAEMARDAPEQTGYLINLEILTLLMAELKDDCKNILLEYYFNKKTLSELKDIFNVNSIQAAKNKKYRCVKYLTSLFRERSVSSNGR